MEYGFKITKQGQQVLLACADLGRPLEIPRVVVGSGRAAEGAKLSEMTELVCYEAEAAVGRRNREGSRLTMEIQYSNASNPEKSAFELAEFLVYVKDPESGGVSAFLYATLGDYRQPMPAYQPDRPASTWEFVLEILLSDEISVVVTAPPGQASYASVLDAIADHDRNAAAHQGQRRVIAVRERAPGLPNYGADRENQEE